MFPSLFRHRKLDSTRRRRRLETAAADSSSSRSRAARCSRPSPSPTPPTAAPTASAGPSPSPTARSGPAPLGNINDGVAIDGKSTSNTVGGTAAGALNVISGNLAHGVEITGTGTTGNLVQGNRIVTDFSGTAVAS